jgi:hypothetical protein
LTESVEASSDTFTIVLRVVGDNERESSAWGYNWTTLFLGDINKRPRPPAWGILEFETVKYVMCPAGLKPENDCAGED